MEVNTDYLFQSDFLHDLTVQKEFNRFTQRANRLMNLTQLVLIGVLVWFFVEMVLVLEELEQYCQTLPVMVGIWLLFELFRFLSYRKGGIHYKRTLLTNGGKPIRCSVRFSENEILSVNTDNGSTTTLAYNQIRYVLETPNFFLCALRYGMFLIVDKRTLSGSRENFLAFLLPRCKNRKLRTATAGTIISAVKWAVVITSLLVAIIFHPRLQLSNRFLGQIHNGMTAQTIATRLAPYGIAVADPEAFSLLDKNWSHLAGTKLEHILYQTGSGEYDYDTGEWTPSENGVYSFYYWCPQEETMYTNLLWGIDALSPQLEISEITEEHSSDEMITLRFKLNGVPREIQAVAYESWYDVQILDSLNAFLGEAAENRLYFADYDDMGCFVFYADDAWAEAFAKETGLKLSCDIYDVY